MFSQMAAQAQPQQQIPPQILQMLMQQQAQRPSMPPQGGQPSQGMPQGSPPPSPQSSPSQAGGGIPLQILQMLMAEMQKKAPQQLASQGRNGDNMIAHLTPGEIMVPPQVQTPKVLATLKKDFKQHGVQPQQFTAGSSASSVNPKTGVPEYNFLSAFLPLALGVAGGAVGGPVGAGIGAGAGGLITGQSPQQAALTGLGTGLGGAIGGGVLGSASSAAGTEGAKSAAMSELMHDPGMMGNIANPKLISDMASAGTSSAAASPFLGSQMLGNYIYGLNPMKMMGSVLGGYVGGQLGAPQTPIGQQEANKLLNTPLTPMNQLSSAQQQLGMYNSPQPRPSFTGYNPLTNNPAAYNFGIG